jgi:hypothetical protein
MNNVVKGIKWPELQYTPSKDTIQTLNRWVQIIGKIRLSKSPWVNHGWHSTLYVSERGLTTSIIHVQDDSFSIEMDLVSHELRVRRSDDRSSSIPLLSEPVAVFYERCFGAIRDCGIEAKIFGKPNELADSLPFAEDQIHRTYDPEYANRYWRVLLQTDRLMKEFRSHFIGKVSPVHFFWGAMDIAVTRFSGRRAPEHPGGVPHLPDLITREAYSHEVSSCGFWPGSEHFQEPAFYSYAYPSPEGFEKAAVPEGAYYHEGLREFVLPYNRVRTAADPDALILKFFQKCYEAAADLAQWDREALEHSVYLDAIRQKNLPAAA